MRSLVYSTLLLVMLAAIPNDAEAFKIKFKGKGGVVIENNEITAICPEKAREICAVIHCKGLSGSIRCFKIVVFGEVSKAHNPQLVGQEHRGRIVIYENGLPASSLDITLTGGSLYAQ